MGKGLSPLQKDILAYVHQNGAEVHGGRWECFWYPHAMPRSHRLESGAFDKYSAAALSRAVRRLEERGLLTRGNWGTGKHRTTELILTDEGRRLTVNIVVNGSQC